jgi:hypothetical protein
MIDKSNLKYPSSSPPFIIENKGVNGVVVVVVHTVDEEAGSDNQEDGSNAVVQFILCKLIKAT